VLSLHKDIQIMTTLIVIVFIALFFALMSVRVLLKKDGKFKGTCASQNPYLAKEPGAPCAYCGRTIHEEGTSECTKEDNKLHKVVST
jgi:hypothetical protein